MTSSACRTYNVDVVVHVVGQGSYLKPRPPFLLCKIFNWSESISDTRTVPGSMLVMHMAD